MKILILGIGNILFGDEGIGAHLANYLDEKYDFVSQEHTVDIIDGGTLAQLLIPTITQFEYIILIDCVNTDDGKIGDVYFFDFEAVPENITWQGSAHEVEMLQTLQMIQLMDDLPPTKIVGVVPYVIGENSTFEMTDEVMKASVLMEDIIIKHLASLNVKSHIKKNCLLEDIAKLSYKRGI